MAQGCVNKMRVLYLESFYGGSHRNVADNIVTHSNHEVELHTLPARFWKWRTRGAALELARQVKNPGSYDLLLCTGIMSIADLRAIWRERTPPVLLYAHETQLSYPAPDGNRPDAHFGMTDIVNMIAADHVAFNSETHRNRFLSELPAFLRGFPDFRPMWVVDHITARSSVCHPGIAIGPVTQEKPTEETSEAPIIIWNHRWEFDKNPEGFFRALDAVRESAIPFRVAVLGENFKMKPEVFTEARPKLAGQIVAWGYEPSREKYLTMLSRGSVVVSTAIQENFGISVLEAVACGCYPLLPNRLSYPEIVPEGFHELCLYEGQEDLVSRLCRVLTTRELPERTDLQAHARSFAWERRIADFDRLMEAVAER
jgi:glycosyltransferase involved in cell wall biosynthesis